MYRTCIFCSSDLGSNEVVEHFPVGSRVAFDAFKGRLWAVCPRCARWNLAPIEERWEAVEEAERHFVDARQRVQSENIGLARMRDGTRLVRVGNTLPGELAAWRYGTQMVKRRNRQYAVMGGAAVAGGAVLLGVPALFATGIPLTMLNPAIQLGLYLQRRRENERVVLRLPAHESPTQAALTLRRRHMLNSRLDYADGELAIALPEPIVAKATFRRNPEAVETGPLLWLRGEKARRVAARAMVDYNWAGASKTEVGAALSLLENTGSAEQFIQDTAQQNISLLPRALWTRRQVRVERGGFPTPRQILGSFRGERIPVTRYRDILGDVQNPLDRTHALALEMALHDEAERRAMEGELIQLEEAWREAETIARIADALPDEPPA